MTYRITAIAFLILAVAGLVLLLTTPAHAHPGHKVGPVCTAKQAKAHPTKCVVVLVPGNPAPTVVISAK